MKRDILTSIFTRLRPSLMASARNVLRESGDDASDALQDAFCRLWRHRDSFDDVDHARAASYTAVRNAAIDMVRRRRLTQPAEEMPETAEDISDSSDLYDEVSRIINKVLTERERSVLMMRDRQGFEMESIAERLDTTEANVRIILSRARRKVRECYRRRAKSKQ